MSTVERARLRRPRVRAAPLALALALCQNLACATAWTDMLLCRPALRPVAELGPDLRLRARVRVLRGERVAHLDLAIEKRQDELALVARNELGLIALALLQRGDAVRVERSLPRALLPMPAEALLADVQHALLSQEAATSSTQRCGYTAHFLSAEVLP